MAAGSGLRSAAQRSRTGPVVSWTPPTGAPPKSRTRTRERVSPLGIPTKGARMRGSKGERPWRGIECAADRNQARLSASRTGLQSGARFFRDRSVLDGLLVFFVFCSDAMSSSTRRGALASARGFFFPESRWMRGRVDLLQLPDRHLRVHLRALQAAVPEHLRCRHVAPFPA